MHKILKNVHEVPIFLLFLLLPDSREITFRSNIVKLFVLYFLLKVVLFQILRLGPSFILS